MSRIPSSILAKVMAILCSGGARVTSHRIRGENAIRRLGLGGASSGAAWKSRTPFSPMCCVADARRVFEHVLEPPSQRFELRSANVCVGLTLQSDKARVMR